MAMAWLKKELLLNDSGRTSAEGEIGQPCTMIIDRCFSLYSLFNLKRSERAEDKISHYYVNCSLSY